MTFQVITDVAWTITENLSWLSLDVTAGSGPATITATATENTTGAARTGTLSIDEIAGGSGLSATLSVVQSNSIIAAEIPTIGTTSLGMQANNPAVAEVNAYNDDLTNYWTGNPDTEPEVSITFDLGSLYTLTEIGIHFWKADERTTTFSITVADAAAGPFTTVIATATSAASGVTVDTEQLFSLNNTEGRYVKFIGIGNSSITNWTSIANVNIYGYVNCEENTDAGTGAVIITEYHNRPLKPTQAQLDAALPNNPPGADITPNEGHTEWFEIYNTTSVPVVMDGWTLTDASSPSNVTTIGSFTIPAHSYAVFSGFNIPDAQGGVVFDYFYDYKKPSFNNESSYADPGDTSCPDGRLWLRGVHRQPECGQCLQG